MDHYLIWCNLKDSHKDLEWCEAVNNYLGALQAQKLIESFTLTRRKLGFGPSELGEFFITIRTNDLVQLEAAFNQVSTRSGEIEAYHREVYSNVTDFRSALYRDFPDPQRAR